MTTIPVVQTHEPKWPLGAWEATVLVADAICPAAVVIYPDGSVIERVWDGFSEAPEVTKITLALRPDDMLNRVIGMYQIQAKRRGFHLGRVVGATEYHLDGVWEPTNMVVPVRTEGVSVDGGWTDFELADG